MKYINQQRCRNKKLLPKEVMLKYSRVEAELHTFLTSALDGDEWSNSSSGCFTPRKRAPI
jgi:hypothetical protein